MKYRLDQEQKLLTQILSLADSPLDYALYVYPWGQKGTPLENVKAPRGWQREILEDVERQVKENRNKIALDLDPQMLREATVSGRGIGKSALVSMLNRWHIDTHLGATAIVTANTEQQLRTRTWPELGKWNTMAINAHWWEHSATALRPAKWYAEMVADQLKIDPAYWYANAQTWSEENPDAFAGAHNMQGIMVTFDEASGIHSKIWDVTEGFFTEPILHRYWLVFSNGRRNTGSFFECFHRNRNFWRTRNIDAREVEGTDSKVYEKIIAQYGQDSDQARVEVYGQFPRQGDDQFIPRSVVREAMSREILPDRGAPLVMGVDPARYGDDRFIIRFRHGRDARTIPPVVRTGNLSTVEAANLVAEWIDKVDPDAVNIDEGGVGGGVVDILQARGYRVEGFNFGSKSDNPDRYFNLRCQMWDAMAEWLTRGAIDRSEALETDLTNVTYKHIGDSSRLWLETKDEMKKRGLASPDDGDALALTFARPVPRRDLRSRRGAHRQRVAAGAGDDVF